MEFFKSTPPRQFTVGRKESPIHILDCGQLLLGDNEQITFITDDGNEYDVVKKKWGFYATPSTNGRLKSFNFRTALVNSGHGLYYIWIVERKYIKEFEEYSKQENHEVILWLDETDQVTYLENIDFSKICICGSQHFELAHSYTSPPKGETNFGFRIEDYSRSYYKCTSCGHFTQDTQMDLHQLYDSKYAESTYGKQITEHFSKIISLPEGKSDNIDRVNSIIKFSAEYFKASNNKRILDVGSGLCVFLHQISKMTDWQCIALDPDQMQIDHARNMVGVEGIRADFIRDEIDIPKVDIITFNKVLEHVHDPVGMLSKAKALLSSDGFVYLELPDGTQAAQEGYDREEFFIEHMHVFSISSIAILAEKAGFKAISVNRVREPSGKYTLRAFITI